MKAVVYEKYGAPEVLQLKEIQKPVPKSNEMLVKVYATTVTAGDWRMRKAEPFLVRIVNGLFKPSRTKILGFELSGVVEEVGRDIQTFRKGDSVFAFCGFKFGAYAEYKCLRVDQRVAIKPVNMTFEEAAAVPVGARTALQFLKRSGLHKGGQILIYGASGSVGTFAVQIAKYYGAKVTAVCSTMNIDLVKSLGADIVVDYTNEDFTKMKAQFDVVFDAVGKTSRAACQNLLKPDAKYISVTGSPKENPDDMQVLKELIETGNLRAVIDRRYTLEQIQEAHAYVEKFHKKGNVVVSIFERSSALTA